MENKYLTPCANFVKKVYATATPYILKNKLLSVLLGIFLLPFIGTILEDIFEPDYSFVYHFGIEDNKDFYTFWIALFGVSSIVFNIYQSQKRMSQQDDQMKHQQTQIDLQKKIERDNRFTKGIELLGNSTQTTRIGAIYTLFFLARDFPNEYRQSVFSILCFHIKNQTNDETYKKTYPNYPTNEIRVLLNLLFKRYEGEYLFDGLTADLGNAYLSGVHLKWANLKNVNFYNANLSNASLQYADLSEGNLERANFRKAKLTGAKLTGAKLIRTEMEEAETTDLDLQNAVIEA